MEQFNKRVPNWCNTSDAIKGTICNGCDWLEVLTRKYRFYNEEHYYCNKCGSNIDPKAMTEEMCKRIREVRKGRL